MIAVTLTMIFIFVDGNTNSQGETHIVDINGKGSFSTVHDAVDAANPGDTIRIFQGEYKENIEIDKSLSIIGNGSKSTIVTHMSESPVVSISVDGVFISELSIIKWSSDNPSRENIHIFSNDSKIINCTIIGYNTIGILIEGGSNNTIKGNIFENNSVGIWSNSSNLSVIMDNSIIGHEVGIRLVNSYGNTLFNNRIEKCSDKGLILNHSDNNIIDSCQLIWNADCGSLLLNSSNNYLKNTSISDSRIGVIIKWGCDNTTIEYCIIENNSEYGVYTIPEVEFIVLAKNNWWGHPTGPFHNATNSGGKGDNVSENVDFYPWISDLNRGIEEPDEFEYILVLSLLLVFTTGITGLSLYLSKRKYFDPERDIETSCTVSDINIQESHNFSHYDDQGIYPKKKLSIIYLEKNEDYEFSVDTKREE